MTLAVVIVAAVIIGGLILMLGLCRSAAAGDRMQERALDELRARQQTAPDGSNVRRLEDRP